MDIQSISEMIDTDWLRTLSNNDLHSEKRNRYELVLQFDRCG